MLSLSDLYEYKRGSCSGVGANHFVLDRKPEQLFELVLERFDENDGSENIQSSSEESGPVREDNEPIGRFDH